MAFQDQNLTCRDCGNQFVWTASEQEFYQQKGFEHPPVRCPACRQAKKQQRFSDRQMFPITCSKCGKAGEVPFKPTGDKPVLCQDCFKSSKGTM